LSEKTKKEEKKKTFHFASPTETKKKKTMSTPKPQIKVGYSTFVDDLDDEYESFSDGADNAFSDSIRPSAPMATTTLVTASPTVTSARVISPGSNSIAINSNRINASPIAVSAPPGTPVVLGARVVRAGRPNAQINQRASPVAMPTQSSAPVSVVAARVVAPSPHRQIMQVVTVVGQPAVVASASLPVAYYPGAGATAPKVVAARVISPSRS
jgi:hypothetical protein